MAEIKDVIKNIMPKTLSRYMCCSFCNASAHYCTEYKFNGYEVYLCEEHHSEYIISMEPHKDKEYPEIYHWHERILEKMQE